MLIPFESMEFETVPHMRGGEKEAHVKVSNDGQCKIIRGKLIPGASIGLHVHDDTCEVIYILCGTGKVLYEGGYETLSAGSCHYCPKGKEHSLINDSDADLEFFAVVPKQ